MYFFCLLILKIYNYIFKKLLTKQVINNSSYYKLKAFRLNICVNFKNKQKL